MLGSSVIAALGAGIAWVFYGGGYRQPAIKFAAAVPGVVSLVRDKFRVDELYDFLIIRPIKALSRGLFLVVDRVLIDKVLVGGTAAIVDLFGRLSRAFQPGDAQRYVAVFAIGVAALFWVVSRPAKPDELKVKIDGTAVDVDASAVGGSGDLLYGFDFDGDDAFDRQGKSPTTRFVYEGSGTYTIHVVIKDSRWGTVTNLQKKVTIR
jgi:hypothetical protein